MYFISFKFFKIIIEAYKIINYNLESFIIKEIFKSILKIEKYQ